MMGAFDLLCGCGLIRARPATARIFPPATTLHGSDHSRSRRVGSARTIGEATPGAWPLARTRPAHVDRSPSPNWPSPGEARESGERRRLLPRPSPRTNSTRLIAEAPAEGCAIWRVARISMRGRLRKASCKRRLTRRPPRSVRATARRARPLRLRRSRRHGGRRAIISRAALCHRWDIPEGRTMARIWGACVDQDKPRLLVSGISAR